MAEILKSVTNIPDEWREWIAEQVMLGTDRDILLQHMERNGIPLSSARDELRVASNHPYCRAGVELAQRIRTMETLFEVLRILEAQTSRIEKRSGISTEQFARDYYFANRPLAMSGLMEEWPAMRLWTLDYFEQEFGSNQVEIQTERSGAPKYALDWERHRKTIRFSDYIDMVRHGGTTNDYYLTARNRILEQRGMRKLFDDIQVFDDYLDARKVRGCTHLWLGPAGTVTTLHFDCVNVLLAQVVGRKVVTLISPYHFHRMYGEGIVYSNVRCENPDYEAHPLFGKVTVHELVLCPGETLFIPVGWWHHLRSIDVAVSISFTNFRFPNEYPLQGLLEEASNSRA